MKSTQKCDAEMTQKGCFMGSLKALALDGPAGAGKSTIAKRVSAELGWGYVDTGAMFRTIGLYCLRNGIDPFDVEAVAAAIENVNVTLSYENGAQQVFLNGENVNGFIRTEEVGRAASAVGAHPPVRKKILVIERETAERQPVVMDGRDIGTVVLPNAMVKVFLTASVEVRAKRRAKDLEAQGKAVDMAELEAIIEDRDRRDETREDAPLRCAEDAVYIDSSEMTVDEVVQRILDEVRKNGGTEA